MPHRHRRSDFDFPAGRSINDTTLDEFTLDTGHHPEVNTFCNPTFAADELLRSFEPMFLENVKHQQLDNLVRHSFTKHAAKPVFSQKSQIAVRLSYLPDRCRGLRVLAFSNPTEHRRRTVAGYSIKVDLKALNRRDKALEKKFCEHSISLGFKYTPYSQGDALILSGVGGYHAGGCYCKVVVEVSLSQTGVGEKGKPMFRHILHNPLGRA